jgi:hypothetical protein
VCSRCVQLPKETGRYGDVYTRQHDMLWAWSEERNWLLFGANDRAKAVDQDDFGLLLSVVDGEVIEGTGRQVEGAGAVDVIEGKGSDKVQVSSNSAQWVIQAILYMELISTHC